MNTVTDPATLPQSPRALLAAAEAAGWTSWTTRVTGTPVDAAGVPSRLTRRIPLVDPQTGAPVMTEGTLNPDGTVKTKPRQRVEVVVTDEHVVVDSVVVRLRRGAERLAAGWEDGRFRFGLAPGLRTLTATQLAERVADGGLEVAA